MHRGKGIAAAALAAVVLLLLLWGSGSGTQVVSSPSARGGGETTAIVTLPTTESADQATATADLANPLKPVTPALDWLMVGFAVLGLVIFVKVIQWLLRRDWEQSGAPEDDERLDDLDLLLRATSEQARTVALSEGAPRNVVVRAWVALEDAASASGLARDPAETAAEFTRRFLGVWDVDEGLTLELAELYREARFSRHPVSRTAGDRAVTIVERIHDQLRASSARRERAEAESGAESPTGDPAGGAP